MREQLRGGRAHPRDLRSSPAPAFGRARRPGMAIAHAGHKRAAHSRLRACGRAGRAPDALPSNHPHPRLGLLALAGRARAAARHSACRRRRLALSGSAVGFRADLRRPSVRRRYPVACRLALEPRRPWRGGSVRTGVTGRAIAHWLGALRPRSGAPHMAPRQEPRHGRPVRPVRRVADLASRFLARPDRPPRAVGIRGRRRAVCTRPRHVPWVPDGDPRPAALRAGPRRDGNPVLPRRGNVDRPASRSVARPLLASTALLPRPDRAWLDDSEAPSAHGPVAAALRVTDRAPGGNQPLGRCPDREVQLGRASGYG